MEKDGVTIKVNNHKIGRVTAALTHINKMALSMIIVIKRELATRSDIHNQNLINRRTILNSVNLINAID